MKKNTITMVLGILFGISLIPLYYFHAVMSLVVGLAGKGFDLLAYMIYIYPVCGLISIVGSAFARKNVKVTRIMLLIPNLLHILVVAYFMAIGVLFHASWIGIMYIIIAVLGILALVLSFLAKNRDDYQSPPPSFTPPSQSAQM